MLLELKAALNALYLSYNCLVTNIHNVRYK